MRRLLIPALAALLAFGTLPAAASGEFHIVAGQPASEGEYPAQAALLQGDFQFCGGTLIDSGWVLTAAHCVNDGNRPTISAAELTIVVNTLQHASGGERLGVDAIVSHPDYDAFALVNDIALVRLSSAATTAPAVQITAEGQALYDAGRTATATGWGTTSSGGEPSAVLLEVDVPLVSDQDCATAYNNLVNERHVCAGGTGSEAQPGGDSCQGDSGGPLWTRDGETLTLIGVTSFGNGCGFEDPGVYTELRTYLGWVDGVIDGSIPISGGEDPTTTDLPTGSAITPERVSAGDGPTESVSQAVAVSKVAFREGGAELAVLATSAQFPDALGGSSLAYGVGPLLFTSADGTASEATIDELQRAVLPGSKVYVLGGPAAIPESVDQQLTAAGFQPTRLFGAGREATAVAVADAILGQFEGSLPLDTVIVSTGSNWPDAVTIGQVGSWWGVPILLTPTGGNLNADTAAWLQRIQPGTVLVPGGPAAVTPETFAQIEAITGPGSVIRLAGDTRFSTASAVTNYNTQELFTAFAPDVIVAVNLRREPDAFAHVLSASMLTGAFAGVMAPVEGGAGDRVPDTVLDSICGLDARVVIAGGEDLISPTVVPVVAGASGGQGCDATTPISIGSVARSAVTPNLSERNFQFEGTAGQSVQIRVDAPNLGMGEGRLDPKVALFAPDGTLVGENDDNPEEPGLNSLLRTELTQTGTYRIAVTRFGETLGEFALSLDPSPPATTIEAVASESTPSTTHRVTGPPGARVIVEMRALQDGVDPVLTAQAPDGTEVASNDDGMTFPNARLSFRMPAGGAVDIVAAVYFDSYGPYRLNIIDPSGQLAVG